MSYGPGVSTYVCVGHSRLHSHPTLYGRLSRFVLHRASRPRIVPLGFLEVPSKSVTATYRPAPITLRASIMRRFARPKPCLDAKKVPSSKFSTDGTVTTHQTNTSCIEQLHVCELSIQCFTMFNCGMEAQGSEGYRSQKGYEN